MSIFLNLLIYSFIALSLVACKYRKPSPIVKNGIIDLSEWDFEKDGVVDLVGDWNIIWQKFETIENIESQKNNFHEVPSSWTHIEGNSPDSIGYASYLLEVKIGNKIPNDKNLSLLFLNMSPSKVFVFDKKSHSLMSLIDFGVPSEDAGKEVPFNMPKYGSWLHKGIDSFYIIVHISNHLYSRGGIWVAPKLGYETDISRDYHGSRISKIILLGGLIFTCLYNFVIFSLRKEDKDSFWFALFCFSTFLRLISTERFFQTIGIGDSQFGFEILMKLEYFSLPLIVVSMIFYMHSMMPNRIYKVIVNVFCFLGLVSIGIILFTPALVYSRILWFFQLQALLAIVFSIVHEVKYLSENRRIAGWFLLGILVVLLGTVNDILYYRGSINTGELGSISFTVFIIIQNYLISGKSANAFSAVQHSHKQLAKVFYYHQIEMIKSGKELEETMPTHLEEGVVLAFDIINSSKIKHFETKEFLGKVIHECLDLLSDNYNSVEKSANGFRIKEVGDGFLCSIGYPFKVPESIKAPDLAIELARKFVEIVDKNVDHFGFYDDVFCGIGIAMGNLQGYFPNSGTKEYDLYGKGIVLATRYESMRKQIFPTLDSHAIIIQSAIFNSISPENRLTFNKYNIPANNGVRDDPEALELYFDLVPSKRPDRFQSLKKIGSVAGINIK